MAEEQSMEIVRQYFPPWLQQQIIRFAQEFPMLQEIRCRIGGPVLLRLQQGVERRAAERLSAEDMQHLVSRISQGSAYAWEEEFRRGYLTLPGGHRVGLVGKGVLEHGRIRTQKYINGLNFRIARAIPGAADELVEQVLANGTIQNTLLVSPPGCGKTTMLRDLIRQLSIGVPRLQFAGVNVSVVDERSELAGCVQGIPQLDVGYRTDVLDGCPKSEGIRLMIRSMTPQVVAADEIGTAADALAIEEALQSGVHIVTTVHGNGLRDLECHPALRPLIAAGYFPLIVALYWQDGRVRLRYEQRTGGR